MVASLTLLTYITIAVISATSGRGVTPEVTLIRVFKERLVASLTLLTYITIAVISAASGRGVTPEATLIRVYKERLVASLTLLTYITVSGVGGWERKILRRILGYSAESGLLLVACAIPSDPPLFTTVVATVLKRTWFTLLFFLSALVFSQLSRYGLATPSSHDGYCAGAPTCRQPVLRTLCFTNRWHHQLSSVFIYLTNSPFGLHVYHLHWVSSLGR